jgi:NAD(P)-dependent dehydrogenase (short-subunit alcohol dehydrogenase family)
MDTTNLEGRSALVTGAGSGIGKQTALLLARRGARLFLCDVNEPGLAETERAVRELGREVLALRVDVSQREPMRAFAEAVHARVEAVDLLVNNAGVGIGGGFLDTSLADWDWIVGINLMGVVHGCHFFVPPMVRRGRGGHVVNLSSAAGYLASAALAAYCTTKFGVLGLSEALRDELQPLGIGVTAICPGIVNTNITRSSPLRGVADTPETRERMVGMYQRRNYGPERVALNILRAVQRNRAVAPITPEAWTMYALKRLSPTFTAWLSRRMGQRLAPPAASPPGR